MISYSYLILLLVLLGSSCSDDQKPSSYLVQEETHPTDSQKSTIDVDMAMEALNTIQLTGDGGMTLYLTFPDIHHNECQGEVSTYEISQEEFRDALLEVMAKNNQTLTDLVRSRLASTASQPLNLYRVKTCGSTTEPLATTEGQIPLHKGTWIITAIFGRSDLLINW